MGGYRKFVVLDGLRGCAAFCVIFWHAAAAFGDTIRPASGYLAVDVFFCISGFVLAHAYGERLTAGLTVAEFMKTRLTRLYPLYAAGTLISIVGLLIGIATGKSDWSLISLLQASLLAAFMLPSQANGSAGLYPLNNPAWSLGLELLVNVVFAWGWRFLSTTVLLIITVVSAFLLYKTAAACGSLNVGHNWATVAYGLPRVLFGFFAGMLVYRGKITLGRKYANIAIAFPIILTLVLFGNPTNRVLYDSICAIVVSPLLVWLGAGLSAKESVTKIFLFVGAISYALYVIHVPILAIVSHGFNPPRSAGIELAFVAGLVLVSWWLDKMFDGPARRVIRRYLPQT